MRSTRTSSASRRSRRRTRRSRARGSAGRTSRSSSSTRRSRRSRSRAWAGGASWTRSASTSTAARSRSGTRSAPRACGYSPRSHTSCGAAAVATASPRCASESDRDWRWCSMGEPALDWPAYKSTALRHPKRPLVHVGLERSGPALAHLRPGEMVDDLTKDGPVGERITVSGRLLDSDGRPIRDSLIEIWQANAAGRYRHRADRWPAPLDPGFAGGGRTVTDAEGRYEFVTIKPGPYPWGNHPNAWRPAHIHFSVVGRTFDQRLVT